MRITLPHSTTKADAKKRLKGLLTNLAKKHSEVVSDVEEKWTRDRLDFGFRAKGLKATGTVDITDDEVILEGKLPLLAKPFEPKIKSAIEKEAKKLFRA